MATIKICFRSQTLEMTKRYAAKASRFGSEEYNALQAARRDYPDFKVAIVEPKAKKTKDDEDATQAKDVYKGLTFKYMEKYIKAHDKDGSVMATYLMLRGKSDDAVEALAESASYKEIREWFLMTFPAIAEFHKKRAALLSKAAAKPEATATEETAA